LESATVPAAIAWMHKLSNLNTVSWWARTFMNARVEHNYLPIICRYDDIQHEKIRHLSFIIIVVNVVNHRRECHFHIDLSASGTR
jgi:hypothetical protein